MSDTTDNVIVFKTREEVRRKAEFEAAHNEAYALIERALLMLKTESDEGNRSVTGAAVVITFSDGSYGSIIPHHCMDFSRLIGATCDMQHRLIVQSNESSTEVAE